MAITNYGELKTAISNWSIDNNLSDRIPEFIALCESRVRSDIELVSQEVTETLAISSELTAYNPGLIQVKRLNIQGNPPNILQYRTNQQISLLDYSEVGKPKFYTITGDNIRVYPTPNQAYTADITYTKALDAFVDDADTNYILSNFPGVYLYGSLLELSKYVQDNEETERYSTLYLGAVKDVMRSEVKKKFPQDVRITNDRYLP